jgi:hypothetical protein
MNTPKINRNDEGKRRKRKNEGINRRKDTLINKAYELGWLRVISQAFITALTLLVKQRLRARFFSSLQ